MALEARDVSFSYGGAPVLQGVSLTVEPGRPLPSAPLPDLGKPPSAVFWLVIFSRTWARCWWTATRCLGEAPARCS